MTDAERRLRARRDRLRDEKHRRAVEIADWLLHTERDVPAELRRAYRDADQRLALAHRALIASMSEQLAAGNAKAPGASHGPGAFAPGSGTRRGLKLKRNQNEYTAPEGGR